MKKKIFTVIIFILCAVMLCGCGSVGYSITIGSDGQVKTQFSIQFDINQITSTGKEFADFKSNIEYVAYQIVQNLYSNFDAAVNSASETNVVKTYLGDMEKQQIKNYTKSKISPITQRPLISWKQQNKTIYCDISLTFENIYAYRFFNGTFIDEEDDEGTVLVDEFFVVKEYNYSLTPFDDIENNTIAKYFLSYFGNSFSVEDMKYSFVYSSPSSKLYSDADVVYQDKNGNYVHLWNFDASELKNAGEGKICTYSIKIRAWVWYVGAIILSVLVAVVLFVVAKYKKDKKNDMPYETFDISNDNLNDISQ